MSLLEAVVVDTERIRSSSLALQAKVAEISVRIGDLMQDNVHWHREALAIMRQTCELARERALLVRRLEAAAEPPNDRSG